MCCYAYKFSRAIILTSFLFILLSVANHSRAATNSVATLTPIIHYLLDDRRNVCVGDVEDLIQMPAGSTLHITCRYDLKLTSIALPANAKLEFDGGSIVNGSLVFSGGTIDGALLNHRLEISGDTSLDSPEFTFNPTNWGIRQGEVATPAAKANKDRLNQAIELVHRLEGKIFMMDKIDAYFDVAETFIRVNPKRQSLKSILIPSNFDFRMTERTYLRVQPNNSPAYHLMSVLEGENIRISGGNLIGDRWQHDYSPTNDAGGSPRNTHGWGHILVIAGGVNIMVENIYLAQGSGDAFIVTANSIRNPDGTPGGGTVISRNVILRNSTITDARRNGMALTDGHDILIENNLVTNTGLGNNPANCTPSAPVGSCTSSGYNPRYGADLEPHRERAPNGQLLEYQRITDVIFRGNTFKNNYKGDIDLFATWNVLIEGNVFDGWIANVASHDIVIRNNLMKARADSPLSTGLLLHSERTAPDGTGLNYNYTIHGNTVEGYQNAVSFAGDSFSVFDNTFKDFKNGVALGNLTNSTFENNRSDTNVPSSLGYYSRGALIDNVVLTNESANVRRHPFRFTNVEAPPATTNRHLKFVGGVFISKDGNASQIDTSKNIEINGAMLNSPVIINDSENINVIP